MIIDSLIKSLSLIYIQRVCTNMSLSIDNLKFKDSQ